MTRNGEKNNAARKEDENPGAEPLARNPNPRANENIEEKTAGKEAGSAGIEDEVGTEITDGEDG